MPQFTPPTDGMTVRELVALGRFPWHGTLGRFSDRRTRAKVERRDRPHGASHDFADRVVDSLSGGERQRAWLAMMLAQDTRCLLLDEPTSALDVAHRGRRCSRWCEEHQPGARRRRRRGAARRQPGGALSATTIIALRAGGMVAPGTARARSCEPDVSVASTACRMGVLPASGRAARRSATCL